MTIHFMPHEHLPFYQLARKLNRLVTPLIAKVHDRDQKLAIQLHTSSNSVALNCGEGAGEFRSREKCRFYRYGLRSVTEVGSGLHVAVDKRYLTDVEIGDAYAVGCELAKQLILLINSLERRGRRRAKSGEAKGKYGFRKTLEGDEVNDLKEEDGEMKEGGEDESAEE